MPKKHFFRENCEIPSLNVDFITAYWNKFCFVWFWRFQNIHFVSVFHHFFFEFDFLEIRTQFMVSVMTHYALIFSFILCFLLMFYSEQENEFGSLKWRKTLKLPHAWDEKCILLLNIWPRIKRKDDCSHPRNKFTWIIGGNHAD